MVTGPRLRAWIIGPGDHEVDGELSKDSSVHDTVHDHATLGKIEGTWVVEAITTIVPPRAVEDELPSVALFALSWFVLILEKAHVTECGPRAFEKVLLS